MSRWFFLNVRWVILFSLVLAVLSFPVMARVWFDYLHAGNQWRQGDWLINFGSGFVRRGLMGEAFIWVSDMTGISLLVVVLIFQSLLFIALVMTFWIIGLMYSNRRILLLLVASPAFFPIFWAGDLQGIMRKELFGLLALGLLTMSSVISVRAAFYGSLAVVLFILGSIGNILHSFMAGSMVAGLYLAHEGGQISKQVFRVLATISLAMAALWMGVAIWFREAPDLAAMCAPLIARGFDEGICGGALSWMIADNVDHLAELRRQITPGAVAEYIVIASLSLVPVILSFFVFAEKRLLTILLVVAFVPMLPLYPVATDWGRWISISYTSFALLLVQAHAVDRLTIATLPPMRLVVPLLIVAFLITPAHGIGWRPGGAISGVISTVFAFR